MAPDRSQRRTRVRREKKKGGQETVSKQERGEEMKVWKEVWETDTHAIHWKPG